VKYKQTVLGALWAALQPLALLGIFALAFGRVAHVSGAGVPYAAFALSVLVPWTFLQGAVSFAAESLLTHAALIRKVYFPRDAAVIGAVLAASVDLAIGLVLFCIVGPIVGAKISATWLLILPIGALFVVLAASVGAALAALTAYYRDFRYALPFLLQFWLFASPVAYPLSSVPHAWRWAYLVLNPAAGLLDSSRRVLASGSAPFVPYLAVAVAGTAVVSLAAYAVFKRLEPTLADVI
jgi:lipopolysaccharide transport system permease protein